MLKVCMLAADVGFVPIYRVGDSTKSEIKSKIVETSTEAMVDNTEEILIETLPGRVCNFDDNVNDSGAILVGRVGGGTKMAFDG